MTSPIANRLESTNRICISYLPVGDTITMTVRKQGRILVLLLMVVIFLFMLGQSIIKWNDKKVGETQTTKSASKMVYPSVTMLPFFDPGFSLAKLASYNSSKNLTEYNIGTDHITKDIISIYQSYETLNGKAFVQLNESSYSSHPDMFKVDKAPDITLYMATANDGLQEWATYNPPGPSMPGLLNMV